MKRISILSIFLLAIAVLFISCPVPIGQLANSSSPTPTVPEGMGILRVSIGDAMERTILPVTISADLLLSFELTFTADGSGTTTTITFNRSELVSNQIVLAVVTGNYTLTAKAFLAAGQNDEVAEITPVSNLSITEGQGHNITLAFVPTAPTGGQDDGEFGWEINLTAAGVTTGGTLKILQGGTEIDSFDITDSANQDTTADSDRVPLAPGFYYVDIDLQRTYTDGSVTVTAVYTRRHALHVYQNMYSRFPATGALTIADADFRANPFTVTFDFNDVEIAAAAAGTPPSTADLTRRTLPNGTVSLPVETAGGDIPTWTGYTFGGWYPNKIDPTNPGTNPDYGTQFLATATITANRTVYARWNTANTTGTFTISLTNPGDISYPVVSAINLGTALNIALELDGKDIASFEWRVNNVVVTSQTTATFNLATGAATEVINYAGPFDIEVRATETGTGAIYSAHVRVTVNPAI